MAVNLYEQLLEAIEKSSFREFMSEEDIDGLKASYKDADDEALGNAITTVNKFEEDWQKQKKENQEKTDKAIKELNQVLRQIQLRKKQELVAHENQSKGNEEKVLAELEKKFI